MGKAKKNKNTYVINTSGAETEAGAKGSLKASLKVSLCSVLLAVGIAALDNKIKEHRENNHEEKVDTGERVRLTTCHNRGAMLNIGQENPALLLMASVLITLVISICFICTFTMRGRGALKLALGLLLGGAFSNTYDRMKRGYVVDYLNFPKAPGAIKHIVFNISDFAIMIGALVAALCKNAGTKS